METNQNQLVAIINQTGLDEVKGKALLDNFSDYFEIAKEWQKKADELVITDVNQKEEMKLAREGRLFLRQKRISVENMRRQLKEASLREGQAIDAVAKTLKNLIEPIEKDLAEKENYAKIQEEKRINELRQKREDEVAPYREFIPFGIDLGTMDEDSYSKLLNGGKLQLEQKKEQEKRLEEERIAREKAEAELREKQRLENERLKREAEEREKLLAEERAKHEAEQREIEEKLRKEREKAEEERRELEEKIRQEREKAELETKKLREEAERRLQKEREEIAKLEAAVKAKTEAELKKAEEEKLRRIEEDRKARNAPDKEKLIKFATSLQNMEYPDLNVSESIVILNVTKRMISEATAYLQSQIEKI